MKLLLLRMSSCQDDTRTPQDWGCCSGRVTVRMTKEHSGWSGCYSGWVASQDGKRMHHRMWLSGTLHGWSEWQSRIGCYAGCLKGYSAGAGKAFKDDIRRSISSQAWATKTFWGVTMSPFYFFCFLSLHFIYLISSPLLWRSDSLFGAMFVTKWIISISNSPALPSH